MRPTVTKAAPAVVERWWQEFIASNRKSESFRNRLMENYLFVVKYAAQRLHSRLPEEVDIDDLISAGIFGLMDAINGFEPERGFKFETYCAQRIRGAMLDDLRNMDWVPRLVRSRAAKFNEALRALEAELGRKPSPKELMEKLRLSKKEFSRLQRDSSATGLVSLSRKRFETDSNKEVREIDTLTDKRADDPQSLAMRAALRELIITGLSRVERLIIILYYFEEMTMKEIGQTIGLSESRISQMHSGILLRIKEKLKGRRAELIS